MEPLSLMEKPDAIADVALDAARHGARVIVLRNTVADCLATQVAIEKAAGGDRSVLFVCNEAIAPHHSRYAGVDRASAHRAVHPAR